MTTTDTPRPAEGARRRERSITTGVVVMIAAVGLAALALWGAQRTSQPIVAVGLGGLGLVVLTARRLSRGPTWLTLLVLTMMFVPAHRYAIIPGLPFELEPYRLLLLLIIVGLLAALLLEPSFPYRPMRLGWTALALLLATVLGSVVNGPLLVSLGLAGEAVTTLVNLVLLFSVLFVVRQLLASEDTVRQAVTLLVWSAVAVALLAVVERVTGINLIWKIGDKLPLTFLNEASTAARSGGSRSFGSAQHPIALAVMLVTIIPLAVYQAFHGTWPRNPVNRHILYGAGTVVMIGGMASAVSRTSMIAVAAAFLVVLLLRPALAAGIAMASVPVIGLGYLLQPKVVSETVFSLLDVNSLVESQYGSPGTNGQGRLADIGPAMEVFSHSPFFGTGFGRIAQGVSDRTLYILDNQYLATLLDSGVVGEIALLLLFFAPLLAMFRMTMRLDVPQRHRDLALALSSGMFAFVASAYFFDAFAFVQATFVWTVELAIAGWLLTEHGSRVRRQEPADHETADEEPGASAVDEPAAEPA